MHKLLTLGLCCLTFSVSTSGRQLHSLLPTTIQTPLTLAPNNIYKNNDVAEREPVMAGGVGGNYRIGKLIYAGMPTTLPALTVYRDSKEGVCYLINRNAVVLEGDSGEVSHFTCKNLDPNHYNLYWSGQLHATNGGNSPDNDVLYAAAVVTNMFNEWYGIAPYHDQYGMPAPVVFRMHRDIDNNYFDTDSLIIGDGVDMYYPLTSPTVIAYMMGGMFTQQHAALWFDSQSGGIDVAFDCMTAMAAEYYATGSNTWQVGAEIDKKGNALHYLDKPSNNCRPGQKPGDGCDIDTMAQFHDQFPYYTSGIFNRAFYLLATRQGWTTQKAYDVFVRANRFHWRRDTEFYDGACDAVLSARELGYDANAVMIAFAGVGIDTRNCKMNIKKIIKTKG